MGSLKTAWAARRAQCSHAISVSFLVSQALIRGGVVGIRSGVVSCALRYAGIVRVVVVGLRGSVRPRHAPSPRALPSRPTHSRSCSERAGAVPMPCLPREMPNPFVSARDLAQERKRVSLGGVGVSTRRHRTRNRTRRSSRWENIWGSNVPRTVWIKWLKNIFPTH